MVRDSENRLKIGESLRWKKRGGLYTKGRKTPTHNKPSQDGRKPREERNKRLLHEVKRLPKKAKDKIKQFTKDI